VPFWNCPTDGRDVVVKLEDAVIGGSDGVGKGWRMLMQSLAAGRGISLPASSIGGIKAVARVASAHAAIRKQFGLPIGKFEGIEEPLARMGGWAYMMEAARRYTNGGLDAGAKPAVVTAMMKYQATEHFRKATNDAMDVLGGNAISRGPRNALASAYIGLPVSITVEGANILTRTLMIFGQGAIRCHPYALKEMLAAQSGDVRAFDAAFWPHVGHVIRNGFRAVGLSVTRGRLAASPVSGEAAVYWRKMAWASATFAVLADIAMGTLGGDLKRREKLTGRFADILSWMYLGSATLRRWEAEGHRREDRDFFHWAMTHAFAQVQLALEGLMANMRVPGLTWLFRGPLAAWTRVNPISGPPSDALGHRVAAALQAPGATRDRILDGVYVPPTTDRPLGRLENALVLCTSADAITKRLREAVKDGRLPRSAGAKLVQLGAEAGVISAEEAEQVQRAEAARADAIAVDSFTLEEFFRSAVAPESASGDGAAEGVEHGWQVGQT
jgi:acyl-CoA dehydrogenase